ncbi:TPA: ATP-binding protein, partial [Vibrio cholerae]
MLFFYLSYMKGKVLYIDPKQEMREQFLFTANDPTMQKQYPDFVRHLKNFHYVTLDARFKENHGVLDPIVFLKGVDAKDTAQAMIQSIYNLENKEEVETFINETLDQVIEEREM